MFYLIYKITNKLNKKIYIGSHKTKNLNDGYMGSGKYLSYALNKYGKENFIKEILFVFDNPKDMYAKEAELVNEDFLMEENTYNLKKGGYGGFDYINATGKNIYGKNGQQGYGGQNLKTYEWFKENRTLEDWERINKKISETLKEQFQNGREGSFLNKKHTSETIQKLRGHKRQVGELNSQYGTCWVTHPEHGNKKIKKKDIDIYISLGYNKGRKI